MTFEAEFREQLGEAIPRIVECLKDPDYSVRSTTAELLSLLGAYRMCLSVSLLLVF